LNDLPLAPDVTCMGGALLVTVPLPAPPAVFVTTGTLLVLVLEVGAEVGMVVVVVGVAVTEAGDEEGVVEGAAVEA